MVKILDATVDLGVTPLTCYAQMVYHHSSLIPAIFQSFSNLSLRRNPPLQRGNQACVSVRPLQRGILVSVYLYPFEYSSTLYKSIAAGCLGV